MPSIHWTRWSRRLGVVVAAGFIVSAVTPFWNIVGQRLTVTPHINPADAIVVLASGVMADGTLTTESLRRTVHGFMLYKRGLAEKIVLSGPPLSGGPITEAATRARIALELGIPKEAILQEIGVHTTRDEASRIRQLMANKERPTVLLVTDSLHIRRAMLVFQRAGFQVFPAPSDDYPAVAFGMQDRLSLMWSVLLETSALMYYKLAGYV